jgi:hypothetical protein
MGHTVENEVAQKRVELRNLRADMRAVLIEWMT